MDLAGAAQSATGCLSHPDASLFSTRFSSDCIAMNEGGLDDLGYDQDIFVYGSSELRAPASHHGFRDMPRHKPRQRHQPRRVRTHEEPLLRHLLLHLHWKKQEELRNQEAMEVTHQEEEVAQQGPVLESVREETGDICCDDSSYEEACDMKVDLTGDDAMAAHSGGFDLCWESFPSVEARNGVQVGLECTPWTQVQETSVHDYDQECAVKDAWQLQVRQPELTPRSSAVGLPYLPSLSPHWGPTTFLGEQGQLFLGPPSRIPMGCSAAAMKFQAASLPFSILNQYSKGVGDDLFDDGAKPFCIEEFEKHHLSMYLPQLELF